MARVLNGSHSLTCTPRVHPRLKRNEPYLFLPSQPKLVLIYRPRWDGRLSWPWVAGWLHTEINVRNRELNPESVAHLSTNRARRRLTSLIEAEAGTHLPTPEGWKEVELTLGGWLAKYRNKCPVPPLQVNWSGHDVDL